MLIDILTRFVTRDVTRLANFFHTLEQRLEAFLAQHALDVQAIKSDIEDAVAYAKHDIAEIEARVENKVAELTGKIAEKEATALAVAAMKSALPTTTNQSGALGIDTSTTAADKSPQSATAIPK